MENHQIINKASTKKWFNGIDEFMKKRNTMTKEINGHDDKCRYVNLQLFKSIYGHGLEVKFVKLLFLLLKKQISKFIEHKN